MILKVSGKSKMGFCDAFYRLPAGVFDGKALPEVVVPPAIAFDRHRQERGVSNYFSVTPDQLERIRVDEIGAMWLAAGRVIVTDLQEVPIWSKPKNLARLSELENENAQLRAQLAGADVAVRPPARARGPRKMKGTSLSIGGGNVLDGLAGSR